MDARRFDALARTLTAGNRRGLVGILLAWSGLGGLLAFLGLDDADAKGRRKRRRRRHKHGQGRPKNRRKKRKNRKTCKRKSRAKICAGTCGIVKNKQTCKKKIDCGPCACDPPCPVCQTCQAGPTTPGVCVPDPAQVGDECGPNQVCQADGTCACDASSCGGTTPICVEGQCAACSEAQPCPDGCCAGDGSCQPGTSPQACGVDGATCQVCAEDLICTQGLCACGDVCANGCPYTTIQEAITDPQGPTTIRLCAERYPGTLTITKDLTLQGAGDGEDGTILDAEGGGSVVRIASAVTVTLEDLSLTGGNMGQGGGIFNRLGIVVLERCRVADNTASGQGGGIYNNGGSITLNDSTVSLNEVSDSSGQGGGIYNSASTLVLNDSHVTGNSAGSVGGGIFNSGTAPELNDGSTVCGNTPDQCVGFSNSACTEVCPP